MNQSNSPLVSVVIPAYNRAPYIRQTVESVFAQRYDGIELIVVNDGSTDETSDILESFGDRLTLLHHPDKVNKGQSASINLGLHHCKGKYLAILDSDDYWDPKKISLQVSKMEADPSIGLVYGNGHAVNDEGKKLYDIYKKNHQEQNDPGEVLKTAYFFLPSNSMVRMSVMKEAGEFDEELRAAQDHDMAIRIAEKTNLAYIPEFIFYYRRHEDSISFKSARRRWENGFYILQKAIQREYPYSKKTIRQRSAVLNFRMFQVCKQEHKYLSALGYLVKSAFQDPKRSFKVLFGRESVGNPH